MKRILLLAVTFILVACMASAAMAKLPIFFNGPVNVISPNGSVITESMVLEIVFSDKFPNLFSGALYIGCCEWDVTGVVNDDGKYWIVSEDLIMKATPNVSLKGIVQFKDKCAQFQDHLGPVKGLTAKEGPENTGTFEIKQRP